MESRTEKRQLFVELSQEQLAEKRDQLIAVLDEIDAETAKLDAFKRESKGNTAVLEARLDGLRTAIKKRGVTKDVECVWEHDYTAQMARLRRTDTGEIIADRPLTSDDLQKDLPLTDEQQSEQSQAIAAIGFDGDELEAEVLESTCSNCEAPCAGEVCRECEAAEACMMWALDNFEASESDKWSPRELSYAWETEAGKEYSGVRVPVVETIIEVTGAERRGRSVMVRRKNQA